MSAAELLGHAWSMMLWATVASVVVMAIGIPLRAWFGPGHAYAAWVFLPIAILISVAPRSHSVVMPTFVGHGVRLLSSRVPSVPHLGIPTHDFAWAAAWLSGSVAFAGVLALRHARCMRLLHNASRSSSHEGLRVVTSDRWPFGPATVGVFKPVIVLPTDFTTRYDAPERALVLQHEAVHVRRHDTTWNMVASIIVALGWFNPVLHVAWRRFRRDQELACDDAVVRRTGARRTYAEAMIKTVRIAPTLSTMCGWLGNHSLQERIMMLNKPSRSPSRRRVATVLLIVSMTATSVGLCATDLPNAAANATVRITVNQRGQEVTDNIACVEEEQRVTIPYDRSKKDFGDLGFRVAHPSDRDDWEVHDIAYQNPAAELNINAKGIDGNPQDPHSMKYAVAEDFPVRASWDEHAPDELRVEIHVSPGCGTRPVARR